MDAIAHALNVVTHCHGALSEEEARLAMHAFLDTGKDPEAEEAGQSRHLRIAALLGALASRGETACELTGFVRGMRELCVPMPLAPADREHLVDTCGTGGDSAGTFNISTGAALVAAAAGARVAKHGNRNITSRCGSADVLEALGIPIALPPVAAADCLRSTGFVFLYAPLWHPALARVRDLRRLLGFRTLFNLAGPLTNPAGAPAQVMGIYSRERMPVVAETIQRLGLRHAYIVHGCDGLDEITTTGESEILTVLAGPPGESFATPATARRFHPADLRLPLATAAELAGGSATENAEILLRIFAGAGTTAQQSIVLVNAAAALSAAGLAANLDEGLALGRDAIAGGAVLRLVTRLRTFPTP